MAGHLRPVNSTSFDVQGHGESAINSAISIAGRDRQTYLPALLHEVAYAVAQRSANPAAMATENTNVIAEAMPTRRLMNWELRSAQQLDKLWSSTYLN